MADMQRPSPVERDIDQAITALKKGAHLLKYGRRGKPKFCPFRLSADESTLIWYYGKDEKKQLELRHVSRIIPGQRTPIFHRYPRPEKEYQSFSLIYSDRSLDLICKDKEEAEVWFVGLKALITRGGSRKQRNESRSELALPESPRGRKSTPSKSSDQGATKSRSVHQSQGKLGKAFAEVLSYSAKTKNPPQPEPISHAPPALQPSGPTEASKPRTSNSDTNNVRISLSSSSQGSCIDDFDNLGDVFIWGEGIIRAARLPIPRIDSLSPKPLESTVVLDAHRVACGTRHAALVTKQGELFSWGEEEGGRLGHGVDSDISHPKMVRTLSEKNVKMAACGEHHTCAVTASGELYAWGDGTLSCGLLGHGSGPASHWAPKRVVGAIDGLHVSFVSCGPWHTALLTSFGQLFTFGDGTFGALGHGDRSASDVPREVERLKGLKTTRVACGVWHMAAVVEVMSDSDQALGGKLFTWGDGDKGKLGHGDSKSRLVPECVSSLFNTNFSQVACGNNLTVALSTSGRVYTMGGTSSSADRNIATCVRGNITDSFVDEIACGSHHIAVLTSKAEVYTWGKGSNGQLGHGDTGDRNVPTLVDSLKDKQVKSIACGSNFTAAVCLRKWITTADNSVCSGCHNPFNFIRKRHNCYNCGLVFCKACSSRKSIKASLAPSESKPYRVCDDCFVKLKKVVDSIRLSNLKAGPSKSSEMTAEKDGKRNIPRLSSVDSFKLDRNFTLNVKFESSSDNRMFPTSNSISQRPSTSSKSPTSPFGTSQNFLSFFVPDTRRPSRSPSPVPGKTPRRSTTPSSTATLPFRWSDANQDDLKIPDLQVGSEGLSTEVKNLRTQVETLTSKSQLLEADLERKTKELKEIIAKASDEAEKSKAAKEVIKTLTAQIKEMSEIAPPNEQVDHSHLDTNEQTTNDDNRPSNVSSVASPRSEPGDNPNTTTQLPNVSKPQAKKAKRIVQDEPGVYITLVTLPNGVNELRRVRFSRKRFTEEQAEKWWAENRTRACERHNIRVVQ